MHRILDDFDFGSDRSIGSGLHLGQIGVLLQAELHALDYRNFSHRLITGENVVDMITPLVLIISLSNLQITKA